MPKRDAQLFQILIGQMTQDGNVDIILGKTVRVLGKPERCQPLCNDDTGVRIRRPSSLARTD